MGGGSKKEHVREREGEGDENEEEEPGEINRQFEWWEMKIKGGIGTEKRGRLLAFEGGGKWFCGGKACGFGGDGGGGFNFRNGSAK